jgi:hypothetical protein
VFFPWGFGGGGWEEGKGAGGESCVYSERSTCLMREVSDLFDLGI